MKVGLQAHPALETHSSFRLTTRWTILLFSNAQRNRLKLLFWDGSGLWVCTKRLEKGSFRWPAAADEEAKITLSHEELMLLIGGIDLTQTSRRAWHRVTPAAA